MEDLTFWQRLYLSDFIGEVTERADASRKIFYKKGIIYQPVHLYQIESDSGKVIRCGLTEKEENPHLGDRLKVRFERRGIFTKTRDGNEKIIWHPIVDYKILNPRFAHQL